jgi:nonsense-mediated mRNA decay protein 3
LGYDLANANNVNLDYEAHVNRGGAVPDVVLVRKSYEEKRKKTRGRGNRAWKLKHLPIEASDDRWALSRNDDRPPGRAPGEAGAGV